jgi:hypothetical protein
MIYGARQLFNATLYYFKHWLHDWGDLVLTGVIAWAAIMQWVVSSRLLGLTKAIEDLKNRPLLYCRIKGEPYLTSYYSAIEARLSNLSSSGIWIEQAVIVFDRKVACDSLRSFSIDAVLLSGETYKLPLFSMPFAEIVPIGSPKERVRIQVKFYYSMPRTTGVQMSPIYLMTIDDAIVNELIVEDRSTDATLEP